MKTLFLIAVCFTGLTTSAQYYYKDIMGTKETSDLIRTYMKNKVSKVMLTSYNTTNQKDENFLVVQQFSIPQQSITTTARSYITNESVLISYFDAQGNVIRTVDSSDVVVSITRYDYDTAGRLLQVTSSSSDAAKTSTENEQHLWQWNNGNPLKMLRIKNKKDTVEVYFRQDEKGNTTEESEIHKGVKSPPVFYFYNANNLLTDIVRFSKRANRLLPEYLFEYTEARQVRQKITVPANSSEYLIWRYQYNANGLRTKEVIYNKQKKLTGRIDYQYTF